MAKTLDPITDPRCRGIRIMCDRLDRALDRIMSSYYCGDILAANPGLNTDAYKMLDRLAAQAVIEVARDDRLDLAADIRHDALLDEAETLVQRLRGRS